MAPQRVYLRFALRGSSWRCEFLPDGAGAPLPKVLTFASADKVRELAERGDGLPNLEAKQMLEYGITAAGVASTSTCHRTSSPSFGDAVPRRDGGSSTGTCVMIFLRSLLSVSGQTPNRLRTASLSRKRDRRPPAPAAKLRSDQSQRFFGIFKGLCLFLRLAF
jgi:hypothetical protein